MVKEIVPHYALPDHFMATDGKLFGTEDERKEISLLIFMSRVNLMTARILAAEIIAKGFS